MNNAPYSIPFSSRMLKSARILKNFAGGSKAFKDVEASLTSSGYYETASAISTTRRKLDDELNNASPSFAGILMSWTSPDTFYYMCSRNNNFTNRSQKGRLIIKNQSG